MIVIQHLWTQWTKASRDASARRPRLVDAQPLPPPGTPEPRGQAWVHDIHRRESEAFDLRSAAGWMTPDAWSRGHFTNTLTWIARAGGAFELRLYPPAPGMMQTRWPVALPTPLFVLKPGDSARITWNARFRNSMGGSNRGSFYEEHELFAAVAPAVKPDLFTSGVTTHAIDLTTRIY